jgi:hypothetical protein
MVTPARVTGLYRVAQYAGAGFVLHRDFHKLPVPSNGVCAVLNCRVERIALRSSSGDAVAGRATDPHGEFHP